MSSSDLKSFLKREASVGVAHSAGDFTVDLQLLLEKFARHSLEVPEEWVLKAVQAAVRAGGTELKFRCTRGALILDFFQIGVQDLEALVPSLVSSQESTSPFFQEFVVGFCTIFSKHRFQMLGRDGSRLEWNGTKFIGEQRTPLARDFPCLRLSVEHREIGRVFSVVPRVKKSIKFLSLLRKRARYAPLKITFDSRPVDLVSSSLRELWRLTEAADVECSALLACEFGSSFRADEVAEQLILEQNSFFQDAFRKRNFFLRSPQSRVKAPLDHHLHLYLRHEKACHPNPEAGPRIRSSLFEMCWSRYGVVCASRSGFCSLGGALHLPLDSGRSDIAGLALSISDEDAKRGEALIQKMSPVLERLETEMDAHQSCRHWDLGNLELSAIGVAQGVLYTAGFLSFAGLKFIPLVKWSLGGGAFVGFPFLVTTEGKNEIEFLSQAVRDFWDLERRVESPLEGEGEAEGEQTLE